MALNQLREQGEGVHPFRDRIPVQRDIYIYIYIRHLAKEDVKTKKGNWRLGLRINYPESNRFHSEDRMLLKFTPNLSGVALSYREYVPCYM